MLAHHPPVFWCYTFFAQLYLWDLGVEDGLSGINYTVDDIPALVAATLPQQRLLKMAPLPVTEADLSRILYNSMTNY